jgi:hypothetical protein
VLSDYPKNAWATPLRSPLALWALVAMRRWSIRNAKQRVGRSEDKMSDEGDAEKRGGLVPAGQGSGRQAIRAPLRGKPRFSMFESGCLSGAARKGSPG